MTFLTKAYLSVLGLLILASALVIVDAKTQTSSTWGLVTLPGPALAVSYAEPRWPLLAEEPAVLHPGLRPLSTMGWVYAP